MTGITPAPDSDTLPSTGGTAPTLTTAAASTPGITLGSGNTLRGFTVGNTTGAKLAGSNFGTLTIGSSASPDVTLSGTGQALNLTTGAFPSGSGFVSVGTTSSTAQGINLSAVTGSVSFGSTSVSGSTSEGILVSGSTADISFGNTTVSGGTDGVSLQNNSAGTRSFGTLGVSGGSGSAFKHSKGAGSTGGGTVTVSAAATLSSAGSAVNVADLAASTSVTFQASVSATSTGSGNTGVALSGANGSGATLSFNALSVQTTAGAGLNLAGGGAVTVTNGTGTVNTTTQAAAAIVANGVTLNAAFSTINASGGANGVSLTNVTGTSNFGSGALSGASGDEFVISGGTATVTYNGTIASGSAHSVNVTGKTGGSVTFGGAITDTDTGISLTSNTGATISFTGGISASTGANAAFTATGGGTVSATGTNTITTTTGTPLDVENTTIGSSNLTFQSITANGGSRGVVLISTGTSGHLAVTGTGTAGSGGSITGITGADLATNNCGDLGSAAPVGVGVYLKNTTSPSFSYMTFPGTFGNFGILGYSVNGFTLDHTTMTGTYGDNVNVDDDTVHFCTLTGSASITNSTISNGAETNLRVVNASGTLNRLTLTNDTFGLNGTGGGDGTLIEADGGTLNVTVLDTTFQGSRGTPFSALSQTGATMDLVFGSPGHGNTIHNTHPNIVPFAQDLAVTPSGTETFDINSNHFDSASAVQAQGGVIINAALGTAVASGYFRNNTIGNSGVANSGSSGNDPGLDVESNGGGDLTIKIDNNQIYQWGSNGAGFYVQVGQTFGNPTNVNVTATNNTIAQPGTFSVANNAQGFQLNNGTGTGDAPTTCLLFSGNTVDQAGTGTGGDVRLRQRFDSKVLMPGYTGAADGTTGSPTVASYIQGLNSPAPTVTSISSTATGGGFFNTSGGAACAVPGF